MANRRRKGERREGFGSRGKLGPSGCSVPLPAPEVWLGDSRPTCSGAPCTQTYTHMHWRWQWGDGAMHGSRWMDDIVLKRYGIHCRYKNTSRYWTKKWKGEFSRSAWELIDSAWKKKKKKKKNFIQVRWAASFPAITQNLLNPNHIFSQRPIWSCIFSQVSCLSLLYFLHLYPPLSLAM